MNESLVRDAILAITSYAIYVSLGMEEYYDTPVESYTEEALKASLDDADQIISLLSKD